MEEGKIVEVLDSVAHPETGFGLAAGEFIKQVVINSVDNHSEKGARPSVEVVLQFGRRRDPFASSLRRQAEAALAVAFPEAKVSVTVFEPEKEAPVAPSRRLPGVDRVVAVASGKGGVGKSTVAARLARALAEEGYRVGVLDADIYGPSQPALFGVEDYVPAAESDSPVATITPAESGGVKIMSIGFFISPSNALVWRGPMASKALSQLIRQTAWGTLDYLLIDLPPGTGDLHLSIVQELEIDGALIVSTPQSLALADVRRGVEMFRADGVGIPLLGVVENMAWFTPAELPDKRYHIFGRGETERFARQMETDFLGHIPLFATADDAARTQPVATPGEDEKRAYKHLAGLIVGKLSTGC
jgi:ATP-binding protein involved in chromosome partitioning